MKTTNFFITVLTALLLISCVPTQNATPALQLAKRVPATFDYSPPSRVQIGQNDIAIAIVKPIYIGKNAEYFISPFNEMSNRMSNDFEELLTAKGFTVKGPYGSRDEMTYSDKVSSSFILEISIELNPQYNRKSTMSTHRPNLVAVMVNKDAPTTYTYKMSGDSTLSGNLIIKAKSAQYGELLWAKSIALAPTSFTLPSQLDWETVPTMAQELDKDALVYNTLSAELEKMYLKTMTLAWQQIDSAEMKTIAEQGKKADKRERGNN